MQLTFHELCHNMGFAAYWYQFFINPLTGNPYYSYSNVIEKGELFSKIK